MKYLIFSFPLLLTACAGWEPAHLSPKGETVRIATTISVTESEEYRDLGTVSCSTGSSADCDIELKNNAGNLGADVLVIESRVPFVCGYENRSTCLNIFARAYRKRSAISSSAGRYWRC